MFKRPLSWWAIHGVSAPHAKFGLQIAFQQVSFSCCERNRNIYFMIHNIINKFATSRDEDLVLVRYNIPLLFHKKEKYTSGPNKYWNLSMCIIYCIISFFPLKRSNISIQFHIV